MSTPLTIREYLDQLRAALGNADPALLQDALYDAEDHLRSELAENPGKPEADVLARIANSYGAPEEVGWFQENIQAGVTYANRAAGATTGAWPGYQPFGGWKGSGSSGKAIASAYYLPLYMREQSRTVVD